MDALTNVLTHIRSSGALLGRTLANPPWSAVFAEKSSLTLVAMIRGDAWIVDGGQSHRLKPHDIAVVVGQAPFEVTSDPGMSPDPMYVQTESGVCLAADGGVADSIALGTRTCGTQLDADDTMLTGSFTVNGRVADRLLTTLPRVFVVPHESQRTKTLGLLEAEIMREEPGQQVILDRLLDVVLAAALRDWFAMPEVQAPGWYRASSDPTVGAALNAIHDSPQHPWTIATLAEQSNVSRATLARRFTELLGEPPLTYLTSWRLCLAADLLEQSDSTVESVALEVGYSSGYSLSTAFYREYGIRPSRYRRASADA